ncbi:maleylpyruvate isomerase family mycothiol-dependent enzyme [Pseudarthrobacter sp. fls2-241-R2A-168]|uniref:maleylpyruvate isomerase family mycothiol-dependent enzyme n=1 Tax=Pseudarthrobacter sp. fls2-241-R2A-168 TaxID=3040304 RepID=UPI0025524BE1|nr:maleylpyruvate isomerase family mycothiol-dependent enzyme [Pseudarthrobacter sp. fls2-241-R2A-168]
MVARHDQATDPVLLQSLLQARRGTAFFARKLNELSDAELDGGSLLPGWTRRHVVAHVGYNARAIARLIEWAATGVETPMYSSPEARNHEIEFGATLSPIALRHLFDHSAVHLNVEWRDLPAGAWRHLVKTAQGRVVPAEETVWMRTREVWLHAVDLDNGATFSDIPVPVLERLLRDITGAWHTRGTDTGLVVRTEGTAVAFGDTSAANPTIITGPLAAVVQWAAGRGTDGVTVEGPGANSAVPAAPRWI